MQIRIMGWKMNRHNHGKKQTKKEKKRAKEGQFIVFQNRQQSNKLIQPADSPNEKDRSRQVTDPTYVLCPHTVCTGIPLDTAWLSHSSPAINLLRLFCCTSPAAPLASSSGAMTSCLSEDKHVRARVEVVAGWTGPGTVSPPHGRLGGGSGPSAKGEKRGGGRERESERKKPRSSAWRRTYGARVEATPHASAPIIGCSADGDGSCLGLV